MRVTLGLLGAALFMFGAVEEGAAQTRVITGQVTESTTGQPVAGAEVVLVGASTASFTRSNGTFTLQVPQGAIELNVTRLGYRTKVVAVGADQARVDIDLETDVLGLDEIVVTGQATGIARRNVANAVGNVSEAELNKAPAASVEQMMAGKVAGVSIQQNSGAPGGGSRIRIRGITSIIGPGEPLYVLDGVIVSNARIDGGANAVSRAQGRNSVSSAEQMNPQNRIADLNPDDIANIEILKGASASAIYGSKASNGVILITTKRGRPGAATYQFRQGFGVATRAFTFGSRYFETLEDAVSAFGPQAADYWTPGYTPIQLEDQLSSRKPLQLETSASVSGGSENSRYYMSGVYRHEPGIVVNTFSDKAALRLNLDQTIGDRVGLSVGAGVINSISDRGMFGNDNSGTSWYFLLPHHPNFMDLRALCPDGSRQVSCDGGVYPDNPFMPSNPLESAANMTRDESVWRFMATGKATFDAITSETQDLRFSVTGGIDQYTQKYNLISPPELQFEDDDGLPGTRVLSYAQGLNSNVNLSAVHTLRTDFAGRLSATTSLGVQLEREELSMDRGAARGLIGGTANLTAGSVLLIEEENLLVKDLGFFAQEEVLLLDERLLLTLGVRADRSSSNGDTDKLYYYPKSSASYRVPGAGFVDEAKVRVAYGQSGNRPLYGQKFTNLATTNVGGVGGLRVSTTAGASDARPERQTELEAGVDAQLFDGRVLWEVTGYQKFINDLLLRRTLAPSTGFTSEIFNGGEIKVWGYETVVTATPYSSSDLQWNTSVNWGMNRSRVIDLPVPSFVARGFFSQGAIVIEEGKSATQWVANDTLPGAANSENPQVEPRAQGDAEPRWTAGWTNNLQRGPISLSATMDAVKGGLVNLGTWRHWDNRGNAWDHDEINPATGEKRGVERRKWSRLAARTHSRDASHIKLRELRLSYDLPQSVVQAIWGNIATARVSFAGRNLWTNQSLLGGDFYRGSDPEVANYNSGSHLANNVMWTRELGAYPSSKSFWLNIDVSF